MLPRDKIEQQRLLAKVRREINERALVSILNHEYRCYGMTIDPEVPLKALQIVRQLDGHKNVWPSGTPLVQGAPYDQKASNLLTRLNRLLADYSSAPRIYFIGPEGVWYRNRAEPCRRMIEESAISKIIDLSETGQIHRLRKCKGCPEWFFAKQADQAFHNKECGQKFNASDEEKRKARNEKRRKNRAATGTMALAQRNAKPWPRKW